MTMSEQKCNISLFICNDCVFFSQYFCFCCWMIASHDMFGASKWQLHHKQNIFSLYLIFVARTNKMCLHHLCFLHSLVSLMSSFMYPYIFGHKTREKRFYQKIQQLHTEPQYVTLQLFWCVIYMQVDMNNISYFLIRKAHACSSFIQLKDEEKKKNVLKNVLHIASQHLNSLVSYS